MILIAIGSNLPHPVYGTPLNVCEAAVMAIADIECHATAVSRWYRSAPVPRSDQPDFVNGVISVETEIPPARLLQKLHDIEDEFGRVRGQPNAARTLDLDLLAYGEVVENGQKPPILPHPRLTERAFVLYPLQDVAPEWQHPVSRASVLALIKNLPTGQKCTPIGPSKHGQAV